MHFKSFPYKQHQQETDFYTSFFMFLLQRCNIDTGDSAALTFVSTKAKSLCYKPHIVVYLIFFTLF